MQRGKLWIRRRAIAAAFRKPAPDTIPLSGDERLRQRDYYTVHAGDKEYPRTNYLLELVPEGVLALHFDPHTRERSDILLLNADIISMELRFRHYYREMDVIYSSALEFSVMDPIGFARFAHLRDRWSQRLFNRKKLGRAERIEVLEFFLRETQKNREYKANYFTLITRLHGMRSAAHPEIEEAGRYYELVLASLVDSKDLVQERGNYRLDSRALITLSEFELEERRHNNQMWIQGLLAVLTAALVMTGIVQSYASWVTVQNTGREWPPSPRPALLMTAPRNHP